MTMQKMATFLQANRVSFNADWADHNPHMSDDKWAQSATHWKCTIHSRKSRRSMTVYFSQGCAITNEPDSKDVLDCLASDASGFENARSFEEWCAEYGYDTDSRKAEKTYRAIEKQVDALKRVFGPEQYEKLIWETERE